MREDHHVTQQDTDILEDTIFNMMMDSGETVSFGRCIDAVLDCEDRLSVEYSQRAALRCWNAAANHAIDSHIENEHDTPDCDRCPDTGTRQDAIDRWEAQRPTNSRRKHLTDTNVILSLIEKTTKSAGHFLPGQMAYDRESESIMVSVEINSNNPRGFRVMFKLVRGEWVPKTKTIRRFGYNRPLMELLPCFEG